MPRPFTPLHKIAFILEEFTVPSPGQQLLDRFLIGYPRDGKLHRLEGCRITAHLASGADDTKLRRRVTDFGLTRADSIEAAVADADAIVVAWRGVGAVPNEKLLQTVIDKARPEIPCFIHGVLASSLEGARHLLKSAAARWIAVVAGHPLGVTWRLPEIQIPSGTVLKEAVIVVQGPSPAAEYQALEALFPIIEKRAKGESGARRVRSLEGEAVWQAGTKGDWSWPLLAAAISRSDSPLGDPEKDGRTQDIVGLGLVPKLATAPRARCIEHVDGLRSTVLVLNGVTRDTTLAVRAADGRIFSSQLYCPPSPAEHQYSRLAEVVEDYFRFGNPPWRVKRGALIAGLLETWSGTSSKAKPKDGAGEWHRTPKLHLDYSKAPSPKED